MLTLLKQTRTGLFIAMIGLMLLSVISPVIALANDDLVPGDDAVVSTDTNLYTDSSLDADVRAEVVIDTPVTVQDGPFTAADGSLWYYVRVWDLEGYMPAIDLSGVAATEETTDAAPTPDTTATEKPAPTAPWQEPIAYGVARDNVTCRTDATTSAEKIATVSLGQTIEITGVETWVEGMSWTPVNCAGVGGFIATDYITTEAEQAAAEEQVAEEAPAPVETPTPAPVVPTPTEVVEQAPVTTDTTTTETTDQATTEEPASAPAPAWQEPIATLFASDNVICRAAASTAAPELTVVSMGGTVEITGAETWAEGISWTPVNCAGGGGFIATAYLTGDAPAAPKPADTTTEEVAAAETLVTETPVAEATTPAVETPVVETPVVETPAVETPAAEVTVAATEVVADETAQQTDAVQAPSTDKTDDPATPDVATEPATTDVTPAATETTEATVDTAVKVDVQTGEPADATPAPTKTDESQDVTPTAETAPEGDATVATPTTEATDEVDAPEAKPADSETPVATETATAEATAEPEEETTGITVAETESTAPVKDDEILGTATVTGTNGDGIACRTAPNADASVLRVLPEGMSVFVLSQPDDAGWMSILCGDQVGYAHSMYLYSGGASSEFTSGNVSNGEVTGTGGGGLNCRSEASINASIIGYFPAGSAVNVRGAAQGDWVPVVCDGQNGWVYGQYITAKTSSSGSTSGGSTATSGTATVKGTNGDGLRCRTSPSGSIITVMAEGTRVNVRGAAEGSWLPVVCGGQNGYAHTDYLSIGSSSGSTGDSSSGGGAASGTVTVSGTGGAALNCRTGAGTSYPVITAVAEGTVLNVRTAAQNGWQGVTCGGSDGYVSTTYVSAGGTAPSDGGGSTDSGSGSTGQVTGTATVSGTSGDGLRCRSGASTDSSIITVLAPGATVSLRGSAEGNWQPVVCGGTNGYVYKTYLSTGGGSSDPAPAPTPDPEPAAAFGNGDHAKTTSNLNLRYEPSTGAGVATYAPTGTVVLITGGPAGNGYYPVNWDGLKGFMHGDYLTKTSEALSERGGSAAPEPSDPPTSGGGGSSATGNAIVDYALGYEGYPYVWATHGPYSFDCSGFTYWVIRNVVGKDIGYGLWSQVAAGTPVGRGSLQPGDLVFFQNTYKAGLSHVGIYIGGDQFIHAENENTGVKISSLSSNYYSSRWYGAVRIT